MCKISPLRSSSSILFFNVANLFYAGDAPFSRILQNILLKADCFHLEETYRKVWEYIAKDGKLIQAHYSFVQLIPAWKTF